MEARTQMHYARQDEITDAMRFVAEREELSPELVRDEIAIGRLIIPANIHHLAGALEPMAIGKVARVKINANIGNSQVSSDVLGEIEKLEIAVKYGADTVMDLSTGGNIDGIRRAIIAASQVPIGTVPIYQAVQGGPDGKWDKQLEELTADDLLDMIEHQAKQGVDYMTIHAAILIEHLRHGQVAGQLRFLEVAHPRRAHARGGQPVVEPRRRAIAEVMRADGQTETTAEFFRLGEGRAERWGYGGLIVTNTPDVLTDATADLTWALILATARRVIEGDRLVRSGQWTGWTPTQLLGAAVAGGTLGIIGMGRIGQAVAQRAAGFRMKVCYCSRRRADSPSDAVAWEFLPLHKLLAGSDIVTIHAPLTQETRHLIGAQELARMRRTVRSARRCRRASSVVRTSTSP